MHYKDFKKIVGKFFKDRGFKKTGAYFVRSGDEVICSVGLQRSLFTEGYYINVGYIIAALNPSLGKYRDVDGDVRTRFAHGPADAREDMFEPSSIAGRDELVEYLSEDYGKLVEDSSTVDGLRRLLEREPALLLQTKLTAKRYLGFE